MSTVTAHANGISAERFGSMTQPAMIPDTPLAPTLGTPAAFAAGALYGFMLTVTIGTQER